MIAAYADVESLVKAWLSTTDVAPMVTRTDGGLNIFLAMPTGSPLPAVVLTRVGGGPRPGADLPEDVARISFSCWARSRALAVGLSQAVVAATENLAQTTGYVDGDARLMVAETAAWVWAPDPASDTPRYVVDARFIALRG